MRRCAEARSGGASGKSLAVSLLKMLEFRILHPFDFFFFFIFSFIAKMADSEMNVDR